jgi:very-short-patch-repair endonuclease
VEVIILDRASLDFGGVHRIRGQRKRLDEVWHTPERWTVIRQFYADMEPAILRGDRIDPYALGLGDRMTPIERALWGEIRCYGLPFYMQYPVGRRFVDFGDPARQIAIEADGAAFHTPEGDAIKNAELDACGWTVYRFSGRDALYKQNVLEPILALYGLQPHRGDQDGESQEY